MGVKQIVQRAGGDTHERTSKHEAKASIIYDVVCDDRSDTQHVIMDVFENGSFTNPDGSSLNLMYLWDHFSWGDSTDPVLFCKSISCSRVDSTIWMVTLNFGLPEASDTEKGADPLMLPNELDVSTSQRTVPVLRALYKGGFTGKTFTRWEENYPQVQGDMLLERDEFGHLQDPANRITVPRNSLDKPIKPPLERQESFMVVNYSTSMYYYPYELLKYIDTINAYDFSLFSYGQSFDVEMQTALWVGARGAHKLFYRNMNNQFIYFPYWRMTYTWWIQQKGWDVPIIDQGHKRKKPDPETSPEYDQSPEARDIVSAGELTSEQIKNLSPDQRERFGVGTLTHSELDNPHWYGPGAQELIKGKDGELIGPLNLDGDGNILGEDLSLIHI